MKPVIRKMLGLARKPLVVDIPDSSVAPSAKGPAPKHAPLPQEFPPFKLDLYENDLLRYGEPGHPEALPRLFFLNGHARSGTNWIATLLNLHPKVLCTGEFTFHEPLNAMAHMVAGPSRVAHHAPVRAVLARNFQRTIRESMRAMQAFRPGAIVVGDHTPRPMRIMLPEASHVALFRDGRDVLVSFTVHLLNTAGLRVVPGPLKRVFRRELQRFAADPAQIMPCATNLLAHEPWVRTWADIWANHIKHDLQTVDAALDGSEHFAEGFNPRPLIHLLRYEEIHADPVGQRDELLRFLGVDPAEAAAPSAETKTSAGFDKETPTSFYRKGAVGDWRNHLVGEAGRWFVEAAGDALGALGYEYEFVREPEPDVRPVATLEALRSRIAVRSGSARQAPTTAPPRAAIRLDPARISPRTPDGRAYKLFFICGHMRSGTTWLRNLMNLHPDVNCQSEGPLGEMVRAMDLATGSTWLTSSRDDMPDVLRSCMANLAREYTLALARYKPEAPWIGDHASRPLRPLIPGAPHLYILRDGRDVITSWTFHQLRIKFLMGEPQASQMRYLTDEFHKDPEFFREHPELLFSVEPWVRHAARRWAVDIAGDLECAARMEEGTWVECPARLLKLRYEKLVADTEGQRQAMYKFLELDPSRAAPISEETVTKASFWQENPMWFYRAGRIGDWKNYATDDFRRWFKEEAGETLVRAGYEKDLSW